MLRSLPIKIYFASFSIGCITTPKTVVPSLSRTVVVEQYDLWDGRLYCERQDKDIHTLVIRNPDELAAFRTRIPKYTVHHNYPSIRTDDPLLNGMNINFGIHMLVVSIQKHSMYALAPIASIENDGTKITVFRTVPDNIDIISYGQLDGVGTYHASVIPTSTLPVYFQTIAPSQ